MIVKPLHEAGIDLNKYGSYPGGSNRNKVGLHSSTTSLPGLSRGGGWEALSTSGKGPEALGPMRGRVKPPVRWRKHEEGERTDAEILEGIDFGIISGTHRETSNPGGL